jgi:hypothetical protein
MIGFDCDPSSRSALIDLVETVELRQLSKGKQATF